MIKKVAVLIGLALLASPTAFAHSALVESNPADKSTVAQFPAAITLTFNEDLIVIEGKSTNSIWLFDEMGNEIGLAPADIHQNSLSAQVINPPQGSGNFLLRYRVVSSDGHPISGKIEFTVGESSIAVPAQSAEDGDSDKLRENGETGKALIIFSVLAAGALIAYLRFIGKK